LQKDLVAIIDVAHCLYYEKVPNPTFCDLYMLASLSTKAMENVRKEHMITFHKRLPVCDPTLGVELFQQGTSSLSQP
jgi:hypothetical protein